MIHVVRAWSQKTFTTLVCGRACSVLSLWPHRLYLPRLLCPWGFPGKNIGVGCQVLLLRIFPDPQIEPGSLALQADSLPLSYPESLGKQSSGTSKSQKQTQGLPGGGLWRMMAQGCRMVSRDDKSVLKLLVVMVELYCALNQAFSQVNYMICELHLTKTL